MSQPNPDHTKELLQLIATGDRKAFTILFEQEHTRINSFAWQLTRSGELAREIVQDIFLKLWLNRTALATVENWGGYLNTLVRNHTFNILRRLALEALATDELRKRNAKLYTAAEDDLDFRETKALIDEAVAALPPQQQKVYSLCHLEGLKYAEAAEQLSISPGTVQAHMKQALNNIRKHLSRYAPLIVFASALIPASSPPTAGSQKPEKYFPADYPEGHPHVSVIIE